MLIVCDKGHSENGHPDPGASGNNLVEAIITGQLGDIVKQKLAGYDAEVLFAPRGSLSERAAYANYAIAQKVDCFISLHCNAYNGLASGYESYVHPTAPPEEIAIAEAIHTAMAAFYVQKGFKDRGLKRSDFAVLRETKMPAVLLENLFIDNPVDADFLRENLPAIGNEIAYAISQAMGLKEKKPSNYCPDCAKLFSELQTAKQALRQINGIAAPWMTK